VALIAENRAGSPSHQQGRDLGDKDDEQRHNANWKDPGIKPLSQGPREHTPTNEPASICDRRQRSSD